ncbi:MAG TPA: N-formylglutamate amidohydrolase, partial [Gammaproteobacteria bacterium]
APPFELIEVDADRQLVLACDHARNRVPHSLGDLGLNAAELEEHIAWDIGAGAVTRRLSKHLQADAVLGGYSRLVVDLNRDLDDPTAFPRVSDGVLVPGNLSLSVEHKAERARVLFKPYHEALRRSIQKRTKGQRTPVMICIHSFTPVQNNVARPWHVGILWDKDSRLALPLIAALNARGDLVVGDNEPYSGRHPADYTVDHHAEVLGLAYAAIEIRQDLVTDESGQRRWADLLADVLQPLLRDDDLYRPAGS